MTTIEGVRYSSTLLIGAGKHRSTAPSFVFFLSFFFSFSFPVYIYFLACFTTFPGFPAPEYFKAFDWLPMIRRF